MTKLSKINTGNPQSEIQVIARLLEYKSAFFRALQVLTENYKIQDNIFGFNGTETVEMDHGYFGQLKEADKLTDLYKDFNVLENCIRVKDDKFYLGKWYGRLTDVKEDVVIDLKNSKCLSN